MSKHNKPKRKQTKKIQQWVCDVCKIAQFDDYDEACQHEELCREAHHGETPKGISPLTNEMESSTLALPIGLAATTINNNKSASREGSPEVVFNSQKSSSTQTIAATKTKKPSKQLPTVGSDSNNDKPPHPFFAKVAAKDSRSKNPHARILPAVNLLSPISTPAPSQHKHAVSKHNNATKTSKRKYEKNEINKERKHKCKRNNENTIHGINIVVDDDDDDRADSPLQLQVDSLTRQINEKLQEVPLAAIFGVGASHQALLAEQRRLEFQAQRRSAREKDQALQRERHKFIQDKSSITKSALNEPRMKPKGISALRYPSFSHVFSQNGSEHGITLPNPTLRWINRDVIASALSPKPARWRQPWALHDIGSIPDSMKLMYERDKTMLNNNNTAIQKAFHALNLTPSVKDKDTVSPHLMVDFFGGNSSLFDDHSTKQMREWIMEWVAVRKAAMNRMVERQRKLARKGNSSAKPKRKVLYKDDFEDDDDDLWYGSDAESDNLQNVCLVTGPVSSGKSRAIRNAAKSCNCPVLEINASEIRNGVALKRIILEATQSCSSSSLFQQHAKNMANLLVDSDDEREEHEHDHVVNSLTVVLLDEVDILFESDNGFWPALASVVKNAKCPIFLTANSTPAYLNGLSLISFKHIPTKLPSSDKATKIMRNILEHSYPVCAHTVLENKLLPIAYATCHDVRRMIHEFQVFSTYITHASDRYSLCSHQPEPVSEIVSVPTGSLPDIETVEPNQVPFGQYSVVKIFGNKLKSFNIGTDSDMLSPVGHGYQVRVGDFVCPKAKIINDTTILVLVPPLRVPPKWTCSRYNSMFLPITLRHESCSEILGHGAVSVTDLPDMNKLSSLTNLQIRYTLDVDDCDRTEAEWTDQGTSTDSSCIVSLLDDVEGEVLRDGLKLWDSALSSVVPATETELPMVQDVQVKATKKLEQHILDFAENASDMAYFEDMCQGIPSLSGPCRGFGFDMMDDSSLVSCDRFRPPREEKLYELAWKDDYFFYGSQETYMTQPRRSRDISLLRRGARYPKNVSIQVIDDCGYQDQHEHPSEYLCPENWTDEEDMLLLPSDGISSVLELPSILHSKFFDSNLMVHDTDLLIGKQKEFAQVSLEALLCVVSADDFTTLASVQRMRNNDSSFFDNCCIDAYIPMLRRMATSEKARQHVFQVTGGEQSIIRQSSTRTTRGSSRKSYFRHHFDSLSSALKNDHCEFDTTEVGSILAAGALPVRP